MGGNNTHTWPDVGLIFYHMLKRIEVIKDPSWLAITVILLGSA